jgi:hypothetical protein
MLDRVGRLVAMLLVLILAALGARVLFVDAQTPQDAAPQAPPLEQGGAARLLEQRAQKPGITVIDPDPDLDQSTEPADCEVPPKDDPAAPPRVPAPQPPLPGG